MIAPANRRLAAVLSACLGTALATALVATGTSHAAGPSGTWSSQVRLSGDSEVDKMAARVAVSRDGSVVVALWKEQVAFGEVAPLRWSVSSLSPATGAVTDTGIGMISTELASSEMDLAVSADGSTAIATWLEGSWLAWRVYSSVATLDGATTTWSAPVSIDAGSRAAWSPRASFSGDGSRMLVTWTEVAYADGLCTTQHAMFAVITPSGGAVGTPNRGSTTSAACPMPGQVPSGELRGALDADGNTMLIAMWYPGMPGARMGSAAAAYSLAADGTATGITASPAMDGTQRTVISAAISDDGTRFMVTMSRDDIGEPNQPVSYHVSTGLRSGASMAWSATQQVAKYDNPQRFHTAMSPSGRSAVAAWAPQVTEAGQATTLRAATIGTGGVSTWGTTASAAGLTVTSLALAADASRLTASGMKGEGAGAVSADISGSAVTAGSVTTLTASGCAASNSFGPWAAVAPDGDWALAAWTNVCSSAAGVHRIVARAVPFATPPTISAVAPARGPVDARAAVTISGTGFVAGKTSVTIGGKAATVTSVTATKVVVSAPVGSRAGAVDVTVTVSGATATKTGGYTYLARKTSTVAFAKGSSSLSSAARQELRALGAALKQAGVTSVEADSHAPTASLADARVQAVRNVLADYGVSVRATRVVKSPDPMKVVITYYS